MIEYFPGVRFNICDVKELPYYYGSMKLKAVFVDLYNDYAFFYSYKDIMPFHDWLSELVLTKLGSANCKYIKSSKHHDVDIIYLNKLYIEIETGLKHSLHALHIRIKRFSKNYVYIIVPNLQVKQRYKNNLGSFHGFIYTIKEFINLDIQKVYIKKFD